MSSVPRVSEGEPILTVSEGAINVEDEGSVSQKKQLDQEGSQQSLNASSRLCS